MIKEYIFGSSLDTSQLILKIVGVSKSLSDIIDFITNVICFMVILMFYVQCFVFTSITFYHLSAFFRVNILYCTDFVPSELYVWLTKS